MAKVEASDDAALTRSTSEAARRRHVRAWVWLVGALAVHVLDEALTDFLGFLKSG